VIRYGSRRVGLLLLVGLLGCGDAEQSGPPDITELSFAPGLDVGVDLMTVTDAGLYYQDLLVGDGDEAAAGDSVAVHYTGWLHDGNKFDSSVDRGEPFTFVLGTGQVIPGWDQGVQGMRIGGKRKLVIPPDLGYGASGHPAGIPGNAVLVFDVELLEIPGG
jgi:FKBP-type peptidyl-prolyl cis-trans isomerase